MKQVFKDELPKELQENIGDSRFVLMLPNVWGAPQIIAHGNDPVLVSQAGVRPVFEKPTEEQKTVIIEAMEDGVNKCDAYRRAGVKITSGHVYRNAEVVAPKGELYRVDDR